MSKCTWFLASNYVYKTCKLCVNYVKVIELHCPYLPCSDNRGTILNANTQICSTRVQLISNLDQSEQVHAFHSFRWWSLISSLYFSVSYSKLGKTYQRETLARGDRLVPYCRCWLLTMALNAVHDRRKKHNVVEVVFRGIPYADFDRTGK